MKNSISIRLFSLSIMLVAMLFTGSPVSAYSFPDRFLETTEVDFNRITVSGNVELIIIPSFRSGIAYQECSFGTAKVMQEGMNLSIKSTNRETARMVVFVKDIFRVIASGNAVVKTVGKLRTQYLQLMLKDRASANINSLTEGLYTIVEGNFIRHSVWIDKADCNAFNLNLAIIMGKFGHSSDCS